MAVKKGKKEKGSGIQQAAGLIRYFDEESEDALHIGTIVSPIPSRKRTTVPPPLHSHAT